ncbi:MAG: UvrD-helicase domain-containing protein [Nitrospinae bacterium]|nr:UvrD-helicase domain-containing protein [Nitrospinota bacterium]
MSMDAVKMILEADGSVVARAGAGSGKTYSLVEKFIDELKTETDKGYVKVDELAAITFTDKAAAEMKERVREKLTAQLEAMRGLFPVSGSSANLDEGDGKPGGNEKLYYHLVRQRQSLGGAYISTIHSFCARLLKENPLSAGVDPAFGVMDETQAATGLEDAARRVLLSKLRAGDKEAERLTFIFGFAAKAAMGAGLTDTITRMIPLLRAADKPPSALINLYREKAGPYIADDGAMIDRLMAVVPQLDATSKLPTLKKAAEWIARNAGELCGAKPSITAAVEGMEWAKKMEESVNESKSAMPQTVETGHMAATLLRKAAGAVIERATMGDMEAFLKLSGAVMDEYVREKERKSLLDYDDLQEKALALLRSRESVASRYAEKFRRVMVDEFQDTNELQREIITTIADPADGKLFIVGDFKQSIYGFRGADPAVFESTAGRIVETGGRSAPLTVNRRSVEELITFTNALFTELMNGGEDGSGRRFDPAEDALTAHRGACGQTAVRRLFIPDGNGAREARMTEARAIAGLVRKEVESGQTIIELDGKRRPLKFGGVALLMRRFTNVSMYENAFRLAGVPFQVVHGKGFYGAGEVAGLVNLLSWLDWPDDALALAGTLRSPFVGVSDVTLLLLHRDENGAPRHTPGFFSGNPKPFPKDISREDTVRLKRFAAVSARWRAGKGRLAIAELLETILSDTGYGAVMMSRFHGEQKLANILKLIERARLFDAGNGGFSAFVRDLRLRSDEGADKEAQADVAGADAVSIMTVHQSKGLEFPMVIIGDMGAASNTNLGRAVFHPRMGAAISHCVADGMEWVKGPVRLAVEEELKRGAREESKRLLYVAMTRARDRLVLSGPPGKSGKDTWSAWVDGIVERAGLAVEPVDAAGLAAPVEGLEREDDREIVRRVKTLLDQPGAGEIAKKKTAPEARPVINVTVTALAAMNACPRLYYHRHVMELEENRAAPQGKDVRTQSSSADMGSRVHALLEKLLFTQDGFEKRLSSAVNADFADQTDATRKIIHGAIARAFGAAPLAGLLTATPGEAKREVPLVYKLEGDDVTLIVRGAADVVWEHEGNIFVADYKYSKRPAGESVYLFQLKLYAAALMNAMEVDRMESCVVYLSEPEKPVTSVTLDPTGARNIEQEALAAAAAIAKLETRPENHWPRANEEYCKAAGCGFCGSGES